MSVTVVEDLQAIVNIIIKNFHWRSKGVCDAIGTFFWRAKHAKGIEKALFLCVIFFIFG